MQAALNVLATLKEMVLCSCGKCKLKHVLYFLFIAINQFITINLIKLLITMFHIHTLILFYVFYHLVLALFLPLTHIGYEKNALNW